MIAAGEFLEYANVHGNCYGTAREFLPSKKTNYSHLVDSPDYKEKVREIMKEQHKAMLRELIAGKHTPETVTPSGPEVETTAPEQTQDNAGKQAEPKNQIAKSLDDILLDYIIKRNE